jgi:hypothetical protein
MKFRWQRGSWAAGLLVGTGLVSCNKKVLFDSQVKQTVPSQKPEQPPGTPGTPGNPAVPPQLVEVDMEFVNVKTDAFYKTCLDISILEDTSLPKTPICNTEVASSTTTKVGFLKDKCNTIRLDFSVFDREECPASNKTCNRMSLPFKSGPLHQHSTSLASSALYILARQADNLDPLPKELAASSLVSVQSEAIEAKKAQPNLFWFRVFFEDAKKNVFDSHLAGKPVLPNAVDYNDFVFDFKGKNVKVQFENRPELGGCK